MITLLMVSATATTIAGLRMIVAAIFGARRRAAARGARVPTAQLVRDGKGAADDRRPVNVAARLAAGVGLVVAGAAVMYIVATVPR
jgi:hypothetical protein